MAKLRAKDTQAAAVRILSDLKKKIYKPVYLLMGDEPYFIDLVSDYMANHILTPEERGFNQLVLYGKDTNAGQIIETARRYPMMSNQQVVIVREAQQLKNFEELEVYVKNPLASTILVLCLKGKTADKRKGLYKAVEKHGEVLETVQFYDNEVAEWVKNYLKEKGSSIDAVAAAVLVDHLGADLSRIANELDKLFTLLPENNKHITAEHIERNIGISREYNVFELNNAISKRDAVKALRIVDHFAKDPNDNPLVMILSTMFGHFSKILKYHLISRKYQGSAPPNELASALGVHPFFLKDYEAATRHYPAGKTVQVISLIREFDMRSKGWGNGAATHGELLRELVIRIVNY